MFVKFDDSEKAWNGYTLVMPSISVGNVGQLAADLIISTLDMNKVGCFHDDSLLPVVGNDPFLVGDSSKVCQLMTAAEVFENESHKLIVVQLRSAIVKGKTQQFLSKLQEWISFHHFREVVIMTSSFSHERIDSQLEGSQLRYFATSDFQQSSSSGTVLNQLKWTLLEKRASHPAFRDVEALDEGTSKSLTESTTNAIQEIFIPGGGFAKQLLLKCAESKVPAVAVLRFCAEGDNLPDALELASFLNTWTSWVDQKSTGSAGYVQGWKIPSSWKLLFGSGFHQLLFQ